MSNCQRRTSTVCSAARDGTLWIGTFAGLASWHDGRLTRFHELDKVFVTSLLEDRHGTVWVGGMTRPRRSSLCSARRSRHVFRRRRRVRHVRPIRLELA